MSHKIYSLEVHKDYFIHATFFNGDVKRFDANLLMDTQPEYASLKALEGYFEKLAVSRAKDCVQWPNGEKIDCESLWCEGAKVGHTEIEDPAVRLADTILDMRENANMSQRDLEKKTGIKQAEISKIERAEGNPSLETVRKIYSGFGRILAFDHSIGIHKKSSDMKIPEGVVQYLSMQKKQGEFTTFDIEELPEEIRVELIDGVIYDMPLPNLVHQAIIGDIGFEIRKFIDTQKGNRQIMGSSIGVWFERDERNFLVPDLLVLCDERKMKYKGCVGAPDFVLEVLSPSSAIRDLRLKRDLYLEKGVRELWIMDPMKKRLIVFEQDGDILGEIHDLNEMVPVHIYEGELKIDLKPFLSLIEKFEPNE